MQLRAQFRCYTIELTNMPRKHEPTMQNCVRELRTELQMTQQALANEVQVTRQTIVALEAASYTPSLALTMRIAKVFDLPVESIFTLKDC